MAVATFFLEILHLLWAQGKGVPPPRGYSSSNHLPIKPELPYFQEVSPGIVWAPATLSPRVPGEPGPRPQTPCQNCPEKSLHRVDRHKLWKPGGKKKDALLH